MAADTAEGQQTTAFHRTLYLLPLDHVSKIQLSTNQNLLNARANSRHGRWICIIPLDMYRLGYSEVRQNKLMKKAEVIQKLIFFTTEISLLIFFTGENITFFKYPLYFINIFMYFINLYIIKKTFRFSLLFDFYLLRNLYILMENKQKSKLEIFAV